jgi:hypothetical protein
VKYGRDPSAPRKGTTGAVHDAVSATLRGSGAASTVLMRDGRGEASAEPARTSFQDKSMKGLILAQSERWRRGLGMQVERETGGNSGSKAAKG